MIAAAQARHRGREAALLLAALAAAYAFSFAGAFQFDDYAAIVGDPGVQSLPAWWHALPGMRPLLKLSYALNHAAGAGLPGFHAVNLGIHGASTWLAWRLLATWLPQARVPAAQAARAAWLAALLFALHPVQTEAVTYLSGRSMSLMGLCSLASALLFVASRDASDWRLVASAAWFAAALATRETAWALLPALALLALARGDAPRHALRLLLPHALVLALAVAMLLALPQYRAMALATLAPHGAWPLLLRQVDALAYLLGRPLLLLQVNIDPVLPVRAAADGAWWLRAAMLAALPAMAIWQWRRRPWLAAALLWPLVLLAPGYSIFQRADPASDRHLYLAMLGPACVVGVLLAGCPRRVAIAAATALCAVLATTTALRNVDYQSEVDLWRVTAQDSPTSPRAWNNYGYALQLAGDTDAARAAYRRAIALDAGYFRARYNLATLDRQPPPAPPPGGD